MSRHISPDLVERIKSASDIVEVVSQYVILKKIGDNYKGLCPFHNEKTPSFVVSLGKQIFHCFGCGVGGNVINFIMKIDNISFPEAVEYLGNKYNIPLPNGENSHEYKKVLEANNHIYNMNQEAVKYFQKILVDPELGKSGINYLNQRGISDKTIQIFSLGYALPKWDGLLSFFRQSSNTDVEALTNAGLAKKRGTGVGCYDVFRSRIIFPIFDVQNRVIGFGGRLVGNNDENLPKYLNTPETSVYSKSKNLFGLQITKDKIRKEGKVVIVEGYLDLLSMYQHGVKNVVATLGTALTDEHVHLLKRYAGEAILIFDGDRAGQNAAEKGYQKLFSKGGMKVRVVVLPEGSDPDSYVKANGGENFSKEIDSSKLFIDHMVDETVSAVKKAVNISDQVPHINKMLTILADVPNAVERAGYLSALSERTGFNERSLLEELGKKLKSFKKNISQNQNLTAVTVAEKRKNMAEYTLIQLMLSQKERIQEIKEFISPEDFEDSDLSKLAGVVLNCSDNDVSISNAINDLYLNDKELAHLASRITIEKIEFCDVDKTIKDCVRKIRERKMQTIMDNMTQRRKEILKKGAIGREEYYKLQKEYDDIKRELIV